MAASKKYRPVVFLDTNAVHSATIALAFAAKNTFDLFTETWSEVEKRLKAYRISERAAEDYQKGFLIARYLRHQSAAKADLYYSPITRLELICGALRARAIKKAASSRVPNRWYSRVGEKEIRDQLEPAGYGRVSAELADIENRFQTAGITLTEQEAGSEVWQAAKIVLENIFVDVQDCIVYASAFQLQSAELITSDSYLAELTRYTKHPANAGNLGRRFGKLRKALVDWYAKTNGWPIKKVVLPEGRTIKEIKQAVGGIS